MRLARTLLAILVPLALTGCGYVHFGRMPTPMAGQGDAAMAAAYTNLATEHKILKQELALARKEGDALRSALDRSGSGSAGVSAAEVSARLSDTTRELAALRASYAKLQGERTGAVADGSPAAVAAAKSELEEKLAVSLRNFTELQEENARLRTEVTRTRADNESLTEKLKAAAIQAERTQATLAQLNTDLIAQKEARARAEQAAESVRAQLGTVLAHGSAVVAAGSREPSALQIAKAPPAGASPTAELRLDTEQVRRPAEPGTSVKARRTHVVLAGDTLEKIAQQYYGTSDRWRALYDANLPLLKNGQSLRVGMELLIPEN